MHMGHSAAAVVAAHLLAAHTDIDEVDSSSYGRPTWYRLTSPSVNKSVASTHATSKSKSATAA